MVKNSFKLRNKEMSVNSTGIFAIILPTDKELDIEDICDEVEAETNAFLSLFEEKKNII